MVAATAHPVARALAALVRKPRHSPARSAAALTNVATVSAFNAPGSTLPDLFTWRKIGPSPIPEAVNQVCSAPPQQISTGLADIRH
jgi:hypothetical protein